MGTARIVGASMTRFAKFPDSTIRSLAEEAVGGALADANLTASDIQMVFFANAAAGLLTGQEMIRGQAALRNTGLLGLPIINEENACASASSAFFLAVGAVQSGAVDIALAVGAEKLTHEQKSVTFDAIGSAVDLFELEGLKAWVAQNAGEDENASGRSFFMDIYATQAREYMERTGATREDLAAIAVKNRFHASLNPKAQYRSTVTAEEVLASRSISDPLTLLMCSPIGDGAAAVIVCSAERAKTIPGEHVVVRSCALVSGTGKHDGRPSAAAEASRKAYDAAGVEPADFDVIELHDAAAPAELITYEDLGLCKPGEGASMLRSGATELGGDMVVNPSGGLLGKGHPIGATGCAQIVELADQLRGRCGSRQVPNARMALAENGGGFLGGDAAALVVTVLAKE